MTGEKNSKRNGLRVPSYFDDKHISMMCDLFSKEIDGTDPLYSELAHAMRQKDKDSALNVLRIIGSSQKPKRYKR